MVAVAELEKRLRVSCPGVRAVLAADETPGMLLPTDDSQYAHIYLLNVPGEKMMALEDAAYGLWREVAPEDSAAVSFFLYSPTETAAKYSDYLVSGAARPTCETARGLREAGEWLADKPHAEPRRKGWELVWEIQQMASLSGLQCVGIESGTNYRSLASSSVECSEELPIAA